MHPHKFINRLSADNQKTTPITRSLLMRILRYGIAYRWHLLGMLACILLVSALNLLTPYIFRQMIDQVLPAADLRQLWVLTVILFTVPVVRGAVAVFQRKLNAQVGEGVIFRLRVQLYEKLQTMGIRFYTQTHIGEIMSRLNSDVIGAQNAISNTIVQIVTNVVQATSVFLVLVSMQWQLTIAGLLILPFFIYLSKILGNKMGEIARRSMEHNAGMNSHMTETLNIGGVFLSKLFGRQKAESIRFTSAAEKVRDIGVERAMFSTGFMLAVGLVGAFGTAMVYGIGGNLVIEKALTIGTIVAFGAYLEQLYSALQNLSNAPADFKVSLVSFERVFELLDLPVEIVEPKEAIELESANGELEFVGVGFNYRSDQYAGLQPVARPGSSTSSMEDKVQVSVDEKPGAYSQARVDALTDISFRVMPGKMTAIVGPSGAGKTTVTYLIPRLYDPTVGSILLDGFDLRSLSLNSLGRHIGMVTQDNYLFHDTIRANILYGKPNATDEELVKAAKVANIHAFITGLPHGYDTVVGERGYRLSGGEKQRIALARVIIKDPRILVLDEATSSLDSESEALIQQSMKQIMAGRTSIVIAHRLSTVLAADEILVMDRGRIVERGNHIQLLQLDGLYKQLYDTQFSTAQSPDSWAK